MCVGGYGGGGGGEEFLREAINSRSQMLKM